MQSRKFNKKKKHNNIISCMKNNRGFSLAELAITIAILAILVMILVPSFLSYNERSKMQKDVSAVDEITHAIILNLSNDKANDEIINYSRIDNVACYIDKKSESEYSPIITKVAGSASVSGTLSQYTFAESARTADETPYYAAGNMRGVTITFEPIKNGSRSFYRIEDGIINKFTSDGNTKLKDLPYFYNATKAVVGPEVEIDSSTYENSEFTVFIRLGTTGGNDASNQDAVTAYGQFSGTNLPSGPIEYTIAEGRVVGDSSDNNEDNTEVPNETPEDSTPSYDDDDLGGVGVINPDNNYDTNIDFNPNNGSTPQAGDTYEYGDYIYTYQTSGGFDKAGWFVRINEAVTNRNRTSYGPILESINGQPIVGLCGTFQDCPNLTTSPVIPSSVAYMNYTYGRCTSLVDVGDLVIPSSVESMYETFAECTNLTVAPNMSQASGVTKMYGAFNGCTSLKTVQTIPSNAVDMSYAFCHCKSLTDMGHLTIPSSVTTMHQTFSSCNNLTIAPDMSDATSLISLYGAFQWCSSLQTAPVIPNGVKDLDIAFGACTSLTKAPAIPSGVQTMASTFHDCTALTDVSDVVIPSGVNEMRQLFFKCTSITGTITINTDLEKASTRYCYESCFWGVDFEAQNITLVGNSTRLDTLGGTGKNYCFVCNGKCFERSDAPANGYTYAYRDYIYTYHTANNGWSVALNTSVVNKNQTSYSPILEKLHGKPITDLSNTFAGCTSLVAAPAIPSGVTNMTNAFAECISLTAAPTIPSGVTNMTQTFAGCTSLVTAPIIPNSVTNISGVFVNCTSLEVAPSIPSSVTNVSNAFAGCASLGTAPTILSSATNISGVFKGCTALKGTVAINANAISYDQCFDGVDFEAQNITLTGNPTMIDAYGTTGINYCDMCNGKCSETHYEGPGDIDLNPDDGTTPVNGDTFAYGDYIYTYQATVQTRIAIATPTVPNGWKVAINTAVTDKNQTSYGPILESINGEPVVNMAFTFSGCKKLITAPAIPSSVVSMDSTFQNCTALKTAPAIPSGVTNMYGTFFNCTSLTGTITINANPTLYSSCFYNVAMNKITLAGISTMKQTLANTGKNGSLVTIIN